MFIFDVLVQIRSYFGPDRTSLGLAQNKTSWVLTVLAGIGLIQPYLRTSSVFAPNVYMNFILTLLLYFKYKVLA